MRDHFFHDDEGRRMPVAEMTDADIRICLDRGFTIFNAEIGENGYSIIERLRIEQTIRALGLR